jgi:hypothetical protein
VCIQLVHIPRGWGAMEEVRKGYNSQEIRNIPYPIDVDPKSLLPVVSVCLRCSGNLP